MFPSGNVSQLPNEWDAAGSRVSQVRACSVVDNPPLAWVATSNLHVRRLPEAAGAKKTGCFLRRWFTMDRRERSRPVRGEY